MLPASSVAMARKLYWPLASLVVSNRQVYGGSTTAHMVTQVLVPERRYWDLHLGDAGHRGLPPSP